MRLQTMSHIVNSCPLTNLDGGLSRLHSADDDAVQWLAKLGSWSKKKRLWGTWFDDACGCCACSSPLQRTWS